MNFIIGLFAYPLGWIMWFLYSFIPNYGLVIIVFTLIARILLFPIFKHQHKSTISKTRLQPQMNDLKNKYGKNPQKYQEEMLALYRKEGVNPTSGCGITLIQFPIMLGIMYVIYAPLKYILHLPEGVIKKATEITSKLLNTDILVKGVNRNEQYHIISAVKSNANAFKSLGSDVVEQISNLKFSFLGMDLSSMPSLPHSFSQVNILILIPIFSGLTSLWVSLQSMKNSQQTAIDDASIQAAKSMKIMMFIMPIFSFWFTFNFPAGVGLYWIFSNLFTIIQNMFLYKKYNPAEVIAKAKEEMALRKEQERQERIEARKNFLDGDNKNQEDIYKGMSQKEINKTKIANARKRDAEKYGDYND